MNYVFLRLGETDFFSYSNKQSFQYQFKLLIRNHETFYFMTKMKDKDERQRRKTKTKDERQR